MGLRLLPAERVEMRLRPSPWAWSRHYLLGLAWLAWGATLAALFLPSWPAPQPEGMAWRTLVLAEAALAGPLAVAVVVERVRHTWGLALAIVGVAVLAVGGGLAAQDAVGQPLPMAMGASFAAVAVVAVAWAELRRATQHVHVTNLRVVRTTRWPRAEHQVLHTDLTDLDVRQGPWSRRLDMGTLIAVHPGPALRLPGIRPLARVRRLVQLLVRRATATEFLRHEQQLDAEVAEAMAALQRR